MASMEESKLIFSLDRHDDGPTVAFSKDKPQPGDSRSDLSLGIDLDLNQGHRSQASFLTHSPSSPGSLADLSSSSAGLLLTTNLVKSSSTDLEPRESSSVRGKPLLSLVKSLSTEISRRVEPEVNLSKSDSKLHLHPWKQLTQPKIPGVVPDAGVLNRNDDWASAPFTGSMSPTEPRGSSLIAEFEDTRRKFSEAMQDPLTMLSKIMGDESSGSPKQGRASSAGDSPASQGSCEREGGSEDADFKCRRRTDGEHKGVCDTPLRRLQKGSLTKSSASPEHHSHSRDSRLEIHTYGDMIQVVQLQNESRGTHRKTYIKSPGSSLPIHWLLPVGLLAYGFFVLPLPSYLTGLSVGVACGFMLGLVVVFIFAPRRSSATGRKSPRFNPNMDPLDGKLTDMEILEGWMNETYSYDPETFHPSITHSVHVTLEGSRLQLMHPRANIPRWATFEETLCEAAFLRTRTYQLANSKVSLLPPGLARKRVWNRKYPICVTLAEGEVGEESVIEGQEEEERAERPTTLEPQLPVTLYLFGRTGREKEEWFQHFSSASRAVSKSSVGGEENTETLSCGDAAKESMEELQDLPGAMKTRTLLDYSAYMMQLIGSESCSPTPSPCRSDTGSPTAQKKQIYNEEHDSEGQAGAECSAGAWGGGCSAESQPIWVNSLVGRIFWDFLREKYWTDQVVHKIQKKLSKIKLPYFMNELILADLDMGTCLPQVLNTSKPKLDHRGLWLEMELLYTGNLQMTLETKMNLCKLCKEGEDEAHAVPEIQQVGSKPRLCILADSDEESSSAGSSDEEEVPQFEPQGSVGDKNTMVAADGHTGGSTGRKILRFVDKIAKSKYFQKATENEYIRKKIAEVSNMPLLLSVEVLELSGTLAINIPPPPTDRIWYSFQGPPRLDLHVRPMFGEREVTFTHVTEWIEKKLQCEFQKVFVMPNMDDLYLPLMTSGLETPPASHHSSVQSTSQQSSMESQEYMSE
nr:PREDICTED: testis-expressed sequence 2 protein-like isoform X1 [Paralichthys olivaceus]